MIKDFWSSYGTLVSLIAAGFVGGFSTYIFDYVRSRKKNGVAPDVEEISAS